MLNKALDPGQVNFKEGHFSNTALIMNSGQEYERSNHLQQASHPARASMSMGNTSLSKVIKKRVRNRYGSDTSHMGFVKQYVVNEDTGRAN
jgi:hypothetical protein